MSTIPARPTPSDRKKKKRKSVKATVREKWQNNFVIEYSTLYLNDKRLKEKYEEQEKIIEDLREKLRRLEGLQTVSVSTQTEAEEQSKQPDEPAHESDDEPDDTIRPRGKIEYVCFKCRKSFNNRKSQMIIHVNEFCKVGERNKDEFKFQCPFCPKKFSYDRLRFHLNQFYQIDKKTGQMRRPRKPHKIFTKKQQRDAKSWNEYIAVIFSELSKKKILNNNKIKCKKKK